MTDSSNNPQPQKEVRAYERLLEQLRHTLDRGEVATDQGLHKAIDAAKERLSELEELSREELERVGDYLARDVLDAASFINRNGKELADWMRFDMSIIEQRLLDLFSSVVDKTTVELLEFEEKAKALGEWHTGEVTGIGTLECKSCGEQIHFKKAGHIPPCPKCHGTTFRRLGDGD